MKNRASLVPIKKNQRLTLFLRYKNQRSVKSRDTRTTEIIMLFIHLLLSFVSKAFERLLPMCFPRILVYYRTVTPCSCPELRRVRAHARESEPGDARNLQGLSYPHGQL